MKLKALSLLISFSSNYSEQYNLDAPTQMIYLKLWEIWNLARRPDRFCVDNKRLMKLARIKSDSVLISRRKILIDLKLIQYIPSSKRGIASTYVLLKNYTENDINTASTTTSTNTSLTASTTASEIETLESANNKDFGDIDTNDTSTTASTNTNLTASTTASTIKSIKSIRDNIYIYLSQNAQEALDFLAQNLAFYPSLTTQQVLYDCVKTYGLPQTMKAMQRTIERENISEQGFMKYARQILENWQAEGKKEIKNANFNKTGRKNVGGYKRRAPPKNAADTAPEEFSKISGWGDYEEG